MEIYAEVETVPAYNRIKPFLAADWRHLHDGLEAGGGVCRADQTCSCDMGELKEISLDNTTNLMYCIIENKRR